MRSYALFGKPFCGKDTLANKLLETGKFTSVSTGQIFRDLLEKGTELGIRAYEDYWKSGLICPDEMTNAIMKEYFDSVPKTDNVLIVNGFPRSLKQAEFLDSINKINGLIHINISDKVVYNRLGLRNRLDDNIEVVKKRLEVYSSHESSIISYYKNTNRYIELDGDRTPEEIFYETYQNLLDFL